MSQRSPSSSTSVSRVYVRATELFFFTAGALLLAIYAGYRISAFWHSREALRVFAANQQAQGQIPAAKLENPEHVSFSLWSPARVKAYEQSLAADADTPIAVLEIDKIGLRVPVFAGTSDLVLNRGAGWIEGTASPGTKGNVAIAGHRDGFFRGLRDVRVGDTITLQTLTEIDSYTVNHIEIVKPDDVSVLRPADKPNITLVTCYPFYFVGSAPQRYIVEATETAAELPQPQTAELRKEQNP